MNPQDYFNSKIKNLAEELKITHDLSYLLLDHYNWNDSLITKLIRETPKECINNLHLNLNSGSFPTINSPIQVKEGMVEECPICFIESPLLHFYCGHKMCKNCFIEHIKCYDIPKCMMNDDDFKPPCNALILPSDIKKYCDNPQVLSKYEKHLISRNQNNSTNLTICDHCNLIITEKNNIGCHTAQCPNCHFTSCYKCKNGCHAPVLNCNNVDDFVNKTKNNYKLLRIEQDLMYDREKRLVQYRREHLNEVIEYFDNEIKKWTDNINNSDKSNNYKFKFIESLNHIKEYFVKSITQDSREYNYYINKFKNEIDDLSGNQGNVETNDDLNGISIIKCPKCGVAIQINSGCIHMTCAQCKQEFCTKCGNVWDNHNNFYECPYVSTKKTNLESHTMNGFNYDDEHDKKFYPMPYDIEKRIHFSERNMLYYKYYKSNEKLSDYTVLFIEERRDGIYSKLFDDLRKNNDTEKSKEIVTKFLNDILFGQSIVTFGFIQLHYTKNKEKYALLNQKLNEIDFQINEIVENINKHEIVKLDEFIDKNSFELNNSIKYILNLVESE